MRFFAALAVMMGFAMSANAQTIIKAKAEVVAAVTVTAGTPLDFKNVAPGVTKTIDLNNTVAPATTATGGETTGYWTITKGAKTQVTVSINTAANPDLISGSNKLPIAYTGQLRIGEAAASDKVVFPIADFANTPTASNVAGGAFFNASTFDVDLGGTVTPTGTQASGSYSADITLTATYN